MSPRGRRWPGAGVFAFPCPPTRSARESPAFWSAAICGYTNILDVAPPGCPAADAFAVPPPHLVVADRRLEDGRHFVFADDRAWHRLWLRTDGAGVPLANLILRDSLVGLRHEAAARFDRWLGDAPGLAPPGFLPTAYQARRLGMMLAILDILQGPGGGGVTSHDVARLIIYPRLSVGRGAEWKSSSERRRTQRLIEEARGLMQGGYRALLAGPAGRQKLP